MSKEYERLQTIAAAIREKTDFQPKIGVVLGSGLGEFASRINVEAEIPYRDLPGFPVSTVLGHAGRFEFGRCGSVPVVLMNGRVHYYEGYPMNDVVLPVRVMGMLGIDTLLLTNASGGINTTFVPGDLMMILDHISSFVHPPLRGENVDELGTRFPDMSHIYDPGLQNVIREAAISAGISIREGIYVQTSGPQYETPAEIRMLRMLGADVVGMSTACEAIAAVHMGLKVAGISCVTNMAAGVSAVPLTHKEVSETAARVAQKFAALVEAFIQKAGA